MASHIISLTGEWRFKLDPEKAGVDARWFATSLPETVKLPGSLDENRKGTPNEKAHLDRLSRLYEYTGPAWYQRDIDLPAEWSGRQVTLFLERCHWETQAWLDDAPLGMQDSLCVPHEYDLGPQAAPGRHRLTIRVDNTIKYNVGKDAHSVTEQTQTNWNGIIGRIELIARQRTWIDQLQAYPNPKKHIVQLKYRVRSADGEPEKVDLAVRIIAPDGRTLGDGRGGISGEMSIPIAPDAGLWDEFSPTLHILKATLTRSDGKLLDTREMRFGLRELAARGKDLLLNERRICLRGTLECCIFPLTGYPPMDKPAWARIYRIAASYGLNHLRFHSWCPPEAAFAAADEAGFLLHVELPQWVHDIGKDAPRDAFIRQEMMRILDAYGNHPSFGMLCLGNELHGDTTVLDRLIIDGKQHDARHLYASATAWVFGPNDDYAVPWKCRGLHGPRTDVDFREIVAGHKVPCISHELAQWTVYPNLAEIAKYTGTLRARNFELIRDDLAGKHMLDQAPAFTQATGRLMVELYKEEIESQLRTPNSCGFQLLDLHDFPGQGTALIGTLDPFWDSKGLIEPERFRRFCGPSVPLLRMGKRTYTTDETFTAQAEIAHYGPADLPDATVTWTIRDGQRELAHGQFDKQTISTGRLSPLGAITAPLKDVPAPAKLNIQIAIPGTPIANDWSIWVYPARQASRAPAGILVSSQWSETRHALTAGKTVLFLAGKPALRQSLSGKFEPVFWSPIWFKKDPDTMSILCDPGHPALAAFPTDSFTNWQWYDLLSTGRTMILSDTPPEFRPIVQVIDNFTRNHRLGNLFECRAASGRLLVCSLDLTNSLDKRPEARQLRASLLEYMAGKRFAPAQELTIELLNKLFTDSAAATSSAR